MNRNTALASLDGSFDVLIIGGGATGLGIAVDAATRGYRTALVEAGDFAQATSSRATKLIHGGVRYLASGQIHLVYEALRERAVLRRNAPHLVHRLPFVLPVYRRWELPYYGAGLMLYDLLSGKASLGPTRILGPQATAKKVPGIARRGLAGSILYHDGQFNDARLALALARTAVNHGAAMVNYARCERLLYERDRVAGAVVRDLESGGDIEVRAKAVINATGIFADALRMQDKAGVPHLVTVSRGTHIVVSRSVLGDENALMVPNTTDGRVIFAIPWEGRVVIGTTDVAASEPAMEPGHTESEIDYLIATIAPYLDRGIDRGDIHAVFSGLRPLVAGKASSTARLSREHHIEASARGLITIAGGKWTTYRRMAQDVLDFAAARGMVANATCVTSNVRLHGAAEEADISDSYLREYGSDAAEIQAMMDADSSLAEKIDPALPYSFAQIMYAVRFEMARTLEDVLSRRTRALLLDAKAALRAAPQVAVRIAAEMQRSSAWQTAQLEQFTRLARHHYLPCSAEDQKGMSSSVISVD